MFSFDSKFLVAILLCLWFTGHIVQCPFPNQSRHPQLVTLQRSVWFFGHTNDNFVVQTISPTCIFISTFWNDLRWLKYLLCLYSYTYMYLFFRTIVRSIVRSRVENIFGAIRKRYFWNFLVIKNSCPVNIYREPMKSNGIWIFHFTTSLTIFSLCRINYTDDKLFLHIKIWKWIIIKKSFEYWIFGTAIACYSSNYCDYSWQFQTI